MNEENKPIEPIESIEALLEMMELKVMELNVINERLTELRIKLDELNAQWNEAVQPETPLSKFEKFLRNVRRENDAADE